MPKTSPLSLPPTVHTRRRLLPWLAALGASSAALLGGCTPTPRQPLRIGAHPWPGYELLYLARQLQWLDPAQARLIEVPSASASLRSLASQALEGAALTLDEVLGARDQGLPLTIVAVLDESHGADAILLRPGLKVADLRGKRIGVETSAVGALMLDALLQRQKWRAQELHIVHLSINEQLQAFTSGLVDALVTYDPIRSQLLAAGAEVIFSSADIPGRIIDVLAIRTAWLHSHAEAVRHLVGAHFRALQRWQHTPQTCAPLIAPRLGLSPAQVSASYRQIQLPDAATNRRWLAPRHGLIHAAAHQLGDVMLQAGLISHAPDLDALASDRFVLGA